MAVRPAISCGQHSFSFQQRTLANVKQQNYIQLVKDSATNRKNYGGEGNSTVDLNRSSKVSSADPRELCVLRRGISRSQPISFLLNNSQTRT